MEILVNFQLIRIPKSRENGIYDNFQNLKNSTFHISYETVKIFMDFTLTLEIALGMILRDVFD